MLQKISSMSRIPSNDGSVPQFADMQEVLRPNQVLHSRLHLLAATCRLGQMTWLTWLKRRFLQSESDAPASVPSGSVQLAGIELHSRCTEEGAVAAFGSEAACEWYCCRQFAVLPFTVLCFATVGTRPGQSAMVSPSEVRWRPGNLNYHPEERTPWLPKKVSDVWSRGSKGRRRIREHHMFLRTDAAEEYLYAGPAHLGSYGSDGESSPIGVAVEFSLSSKLPRDVWLELGGYSGWKVEVNHETRFIDEGDTLAFDSMLCRLLEPEYSHVSMTRYEEDSLTLFMNSQRAWVMYHERAPSRELCAYDAGYDVGGDEEFQCACGIKLEFPGGQTIARELATRAAVEFLRCGQLPAFIEWKPGTAAGVRLRCCLCPSDSDSMR